MKKEFIFYNRGFMPAKILIVEDEAITALDIKHDLESMGFVVISTISEGEKVFQKAEELNPDLIIMDIMLKDDMDGIEAANEIQTLDIPVVFLTALSDEDIIQRAKLTNPYGYVNKPVTHAELKASVEIALYKHEINRKLKESKQKYQDLIETNADFIWEMDTQGKFTYCSSQMEKLWGIKPEDMMGKTPFDMLPPDSKENGLKEFQRNLNDPQQFNGLELTSYNGKGNLVSIEISGVPFFDDNGTLIGYRGITKDITERKKSEEELKKAYDTLEEKVEKRTAELGEAYHNLKENEKKLNDVIAELERSNEELQSFAYITSHDLQEPLRNIASFAQLLQRRYKGQLDEDADEFIEFMVEGATRMKNMIMGLLEYSRINRSKTEITKVDMNDNLGKAIYNLKSIVNESDTEITRDNLPIVNANSDQMVSVFQNLISNSIKFKKPQFQPRIHISSKLSADNSEWIFSVEDNGIGMEKEYTSKIFEVFKRLHTIEEYEGTGIGLSIVRRIIDSHDGRVWVESEFGVGSTFYFTLPKS